MSQRAGAGCAQVDHFDAVTEMHLDESRLEQTPEMIVVTCRCADIDLDDAGGQIEPLQRHRESADAGFALLKDVEEFVEQLAGGMFEDVDLHDTAGEHTLHRGRAVMWNGVDGFHRFSERLVESSKDGVPESPREFGSREVDEMFDAFHADVIERVADVIVETERADGERGEGIAFVARPDDAGIVFTSVPCHGAGAGVRRGDGRDAGQPHGAKRAEQVIAHGGFSAEEVRATGDVHEHAVGRVDGDDGGIAPCEPTGERAQRSTITLGFVPVHMQRRALRERGGVTARHAGRDAEPSGVIAGVRDDLLLVDVLDQDQWLVVETRFMRNVGRCAVSTSCEIQRPAGQVQ